MTAIDIVIPAHVKDFAVLRHSVRGVLRYLRPIGRVFIVSREPFQCPDARVVWVPESAAELTLPSLAAVQAKWTARRADGARAAWIYQQLLKLGAPNYIDSLSPAYLVVDSDVVFLRDVSLVSDPPIRFPYSHAYEHHEAYRDAYQRLFGNSPSTGHSLTGHHMLYDQALLHDMMREIEDRHGTSWTDAYIDAVDYRQDSSISEMDVYGWWVLERHPELAARRQLLWRDTAVVPGPVGRAMYARDYDFVAAHAWMRASRWRRAAATFAHMAREVRADAARRRIGPARPR